MNPPLDEQIQKIRSSAGIWIPFPRAFLSVRGKDRTLFLHRLLTHDIRALPVGQAKPACLLDRQGKIVFYAVVHARPDELLLELTPESLAIATTALNAYLIADAVEITDATTNYRLAAIHGPSTFAVAKKQFPFLEWPTQSLQHCQGSSPESGLSFAMRWDLLGMPGIHCYLSKNLDTDWTGAIRAEMETFDQLRIEAGVPWPGRELTSQTILNELGDAAPVSFTKGCFVGQEIVARIKYRAHPPRQLAGFTVEGSDLPVPLTAIRWENQEAGVISSSAYSPTLKKGLALGFVRHGFNSPECLAQTPTGFVTAKIVPLPFVPVSVNA